MIIAFIKTVLLISLGFLIAIVIIIYSIKSKFCLTDRARIILLIKGYKEPKNLKIDLINQDGKDLYTVTFTAADKNWNLVSGYVIKNKVVINERRNQ